MTDDQPLWERQPWETPASFKAFRDFYLPEADQAGRLIAAYRAHRRDQGAIQAPRSVSGIWSKWSRGVTGGGLKRPDAVPWSTRADAWATELDRLELAELVKLRVKNRRERIKALQVTLAQAYNAARRFQFRLDQPGAMNLPPFRDVVKAIAVMTAELRKELGDEPSQRLIIDGGPLIQNNLQVNQYDYTDLTDDDLREQVEALITLRALAESVIIDGGPPAGSVNGTPALESGEEDGHPDA